MDGMGTGKSTLGSFGLTLSWSSESGFSALST